MQDYPISTPVGAGPAQKRNRTLRAIQQLSFDGRFVVKDREGMLQTLRHDGEAYF